MSLSRRVDVWSWHKEFNGVSIINFFCGPTPASFRLCSFCSRSGIEPGSLGRESTIPPRHVVSIFVLKILVEHDYKDSMRPDYESLSKRDRNHFSFFRNHRKPVPRIRGDAIIAYASARVRVCKGVCVCVCVSVRIWLSTFWVDFCPLLIWSI